LRWCTLIYFSRYFENCVFKNGKSREVKPTHEIILRSICHESNEISIQRILIKSIGNGKPIRQCEVTMNFVQNSHVISNDKKFPKIYMKKIPDFENQTKYFIIRPRLEFMSNNQFYVCIFIYSVSAELTFLGTYTVRTRKSAKMLLMLDVDQC
jgi:hypothetical protein